MTHYHGESSTSGSMAACKAVLILFCTLNGWHQALASQNSVKLQKDIPVSDFVSFYSSRDTSEAKVSLESTPSNAPIVLKLPRAMIQASSGHLRDQYESIPDEISVEAVLVGITFPQGIPTSIAIHAYSREMGVSKSRAARTDGFFDRTTSTWIYVPEHDLPGELEVKQKLGISSHHETTESSDTYNLGRGGIYVVPKSGRPKEFNWAECTDPVRSLKPCTYWFRVNEQLAAKTHFTDLRSKGGIEFANQRIRDLRLALCKYTTCSMVDSTGRLRDGRQSSDTPAPNRRAP